MADIQQPQVKIQRARLYKYVSFKGKLTGAAKKYTPLTAAKRLGDVESDMSLGMKNLLGGVNSIGATLNSVAMTCENMNLAIKESVAAQVASANNVTRSKKRAETDKKRLQRRKAAADKKKEQEAGRDSAEDQVEMTSKAHFLNAMENFKAAGKSALSGILGTLGKLFMWIMGGFVKFAIFNWIIENPGKVQKLAKGLFAIGKTIYKVTSFLVGMSFDGITKFLENPISLKGLLGFGQFLIGFVPLLGAYAFLKNPKAMISGLANVLKGLITGLGNLMKGGKLFSKMKTFGQKFRPGTRAGSILGSVAAGTAAASLVAAGGGSTSEVVGAGVGAGAGQAIGAALGAKTGIPGMGMVAGAAGGFLGGKIGQSIGGMMEPLVTPIKEFFTMMKEVFDAAIAPIKDGLTEFFDALGAVMGGFIEFLKPHMPMIKKIVGTSVKVIFAPLLLLLKGLTAVLKFFAPGGKAEKDKEVKGKAAGGKIVTPSISPPPGLPEAAEGGTMTIPGQITGWFSHQMEEVKKMLSGFGELLMLPFKAIANGLAGAVGDMVGNIPIIGGLIKGAGNLLGNVFGWNKEKKAAGGWIQGPKSGYPVSLDGGRSVSFIGHGTEWVGYKKAAAGGAFVVPFDTPATDRNHGLTSLRWREAAAGGYQLPQFSGGGEFDAVLDLIAKYESGSGGYEAMYPSTVLKGATKMTINEVARKATGAVGMYQNMPEFLVKRARAVGLNPARAKYNKSNQRKIAKYLIGKGQAGVTPKMMKEDPDEAMIRLSRVWAAIPVPKDMQGHTRMLKKGESYYAGVGSNKAHITPEMMYKAMASGSVTATDTSTGDTTPAYEKNRKKNNESKSSGSDSSAEDKKTEGKSPIDRLKESFNLLKEAFSPDMVSSLKPSATAGSTIDSKEQDRKENKANAIKQRAEEIQAYQQASSQAIGAVQKQGASAGDTEVLSFLPGKDKYDVDDFFQPKFGLVADSNTEAFNLM